MIYLIILAIGLGVDSFSAGILGGVDAHGDRNHRRRDGLMMALMFAIFHMIMPLLGWYFGSFIKVYFQNLDHWVAFLLLSIIGVRMVINGFNYEKQKGHFLNFRNLIPLSFATSTDAFVVGISLALLKHSPFLSAFTIGSVAFIMSPIGFALGERIGTKTSKRVEVAGGFVLILIGLKVLLDHLL